MAPVGAHRRCDALSEGLTRRAVGRHPHELRPLGDGRGLLSSCRCRIVTGDVSAVIGADDDGHEGDPDDEHDTERDEHGLSTVHVPGLRAQRRQTPRPNWRRSSLPGTLVETQVSVKGLLLLWSRDSLELSSSRGLCAVVAGMRPVARCRHPAGTTSTTSRSGFSNIFTANGARSERPATHARCPSKPAVVTSSSISSVPSGVNRSGPV